MISSNRVLSISLAEADVVAASASAVDGSTPAVKQINTTASGVPNFTIAAVITTADRPLSPPSRYLFAKGNLIPVRLKFISLPLQSDGKTPLSYF
jgi:hypothetical protein